MQQQDHERQQILSSRFYNAIAFLCSLFAIRQSSCNLEVSTLHHSIIAGVILQFSYADVVQKQNQFEI